MEETTGLDDMSATVANRSSKISPTANG
jgi:hypothetical protein